MLATVITILKLQVSLMLLIAAGAIGKFTGVITEGFQAGISKFLMNIVLPCMVIVAFSGDVGGGVFEKSMQIFIIALVVHIGYIVFGELIYGRRNPEQKPVLKFGVICPNSNFMGYPVIGGIYGDMGNLLLSVALMVVRVGVQTIGVSYFISGGVKERLLKLLRNPCFIAVFIGIFIMATGISLPSPIMDSLTYMSRCTTPLAMVLIGTTVCSMKKEMLKDFTVWRFCFLRLIVIPVVVLAILHFLPIDPVTAGVGVIFTALPAGTMTIIFTQEYDKDSQLASAIVITSTLLSVVTIPIINLLCTLFL